MAATQIVTILHTATELGYHCLLLCCDLAGFYGIHFDGKKTMRFSNISRTGRQVLRSVLLVAGVSLAAMAIGCGPAAQEAQIDTSVPEVDPAAMGANPDAALQDGAAPAATPAATPAETPESGE